MSRPFIPTPNTASVELIYSQASEFNENVLHVYKGSPFSLSDLQALRGVVDTWDNTTGKTLRVNTATLVRIRTKALDSLGSPMEDFALPTPRVGTLSAPGAALSVCLCLKLATGRSGRSFRGRVYAGNLSQGSISDAGHVSVATVSTFVTAYTGLMTALATAGYTLCVTSFMTGGAWRPNGLNTQITSIVGIDNALDCQRRRLPGRGHSI